MASIVVDFLLLLEFLVLFLDGREEFLTGVRLFGRLLLAFPPISNLARLRQH